MATFHYIVILLIFNVVNFSNTNNDQLVNRDAVPIIHMKGSHYKIGFNIGFNFRHIINDVLDNNESLKRFENAAETTQGKENYKNCLEITNLYFPQYIIELKGIAIGADVPFKKLFLIHMGEIIMKNINEKYTESRHFESSTILGISDDTMIIGNNIDVRKEKIQHYYIVNAHIKPARNERRGVFAAREEKWTSLTYGGMLSGYMGGYNYHGLMFTVNTIYTTNLFPEKIPRAFLTRALLASKADLTEITELLTNKCAGTAETFRVIIGFINESKINRVLYGIEVTPYINEQSLIDVQTFDSTSEHVFFTNRKVYINTIKEFKGNGLLDSKKRQKHYKLLNIKPISLNDVKRLLGNTYDEHCQMYRDKDNDPLHTMITEVFDFDNMTWTIWTKNPKINSPSLQLVITDDTFLKCENI